MAKIFLAMPHTGVVDVDAFVACSHHASKDKECYRFVPRRSPQGSHCECFNALWCMCLNTYEADGWTHFAMCHSDVEPQEGWLDILLAEMEKVGADVLSVILPIKDERGLTSTALQQRETLHTQRLTMRQVHQLPTTICGNSFDAPGARFDLLISSGLWIAKTGAWMREVWFEMRDRIGRLPDGKFIAHNFSEDWNFARMCREQGLKVYATRAVEAEHKGMRDWPNHKAWGSPKWIFDLHGSNADWLRLMQGMSSLPEAS